MAGLTIDAGVLIGFERDDRLVLALLDEEAKRGGVVTVPTVVVAEVWRGGSRSARVARFLDAFCDIAEVDLPTAKLAGELLGRVGGSNTLDAVVVASAALRGDRVITADAGDVAPLGAAAGVDVRAF